MKRLSYIFILLLTVQTAVSQERPKNAKIPDPAAPEKVMRTRPYLQDPSPESMTVMWLTNVDCRSWVEFGTDSLDTRRALTLDEGLVTVGKINAVRLDGLKPGTKYWYRACSQEVTWYSAGYKEFGDTVRTAFHPFTTWNEADGDFTAVIFNDLHNRPATMEALCKAMGGTPYDLVIYNGDCISNPEREHEIVNAIEAYNAIMNGESIPSIFLRGNHETRGAYSLHLWDYIEKKGGCPYSAFTLGGVRFVLLDNGEDKKDDRPIYFGMNDFSQYRADQADFLQAEMASAAFRDAAKKVLVHHIPIYNRGTRTNLCGPVWGPVLKKAPFNVALNGHQHKYEYIPKNADGNNFPVLVGGGYNVDDATVMILSKKGKTLNLKVLDGHGKILFDKGL